jgi:hypothetical protein
MSDVLLLRAPVPRSQSGLPVLVQGGGRWAQIDTLATHLRACPLHSIDPLGATYLWLAICIRLPHVSSSTAGADRLHLERLLR